MSDAGIFTAVNGNSIWKVDRNAREYYEQPREREWKWELLCGNVRELGWKRRILEHLYSQFYRRVEPLLIVLYNLLIAVILQLWAVSTNCQCVHHSARVSLIKEKKHINK